MTLYHSQMQNHIIKTITIGLSALKDFQTGLGKQPDCCLDLDQSDLGLQYLHSVFIFCQHCSFVKSAPSNKVIISNFEGFRNILFNVYWNKSVL